MLASPSKSLPFFPMPKQAMDTFFQGIEHGFLPDYIRKNHDFTAENDKGRLRVNLAAFTDKDNWDIDTSAVSVYYEPNSWFPDEIIVEQVALSGSPFIFVARENEVRPYGVKVNGKAQPVLLSDPIPYSDIIKFFEKYKSDINPNRIKNVKSGTSQFDVFTDIHSLQLRLFALEITRGFLSKVFGYAVNHLRTEIDNKLKRDDTVTDVAVRLLGAIILAHKGRLGEKYQEEKISFDEIYQRAAYLFPKYFNWQAIEKIHPAVEHAYRSLQEATYSSFTPDMLSELYLQAYPSKEKRKLEGRYDTPLYLTRLILENIPIETIRPENRQIADITCGWGSFLVAGYERLSKLSDMRNMPLNNHILGNDIDRFTAQLARVALLTTALQDDWRVTSTDAHSLDSTQLKPTVIVGNPKFFGDRKRGHFATDVDDASGQSSRLQEADDFLIKAIELLQPGGYLGMLMPQSFTIGEASTNARKKLLNNCDILELWDLPLSIFGRQARVSPMVVFAKKRSEVNRLSSFPVRIRVAQEHSIEKNGEFTTSNLASTQENWGMSNIKASGSGARVTHLITYTTILSENRWNEILGNCIKIAEVAEIVSGAIVGTKRRWGDYPFPKSVPWLSGAKTSIPRPFFINYGSGTILYPNELEEPRKSKNYPEKDKEYLLSSNKVLLVADPNPSWGQRTKVAIERRGYYPSNHFWIFVPKTNSSVSVSLEVIAAVLSWDVSNAWIVESFRYPWIQKRIIEDIPFPYLTENDARKIKDAINQIESAAKIGGEDENAQEVIDEILKRAYKLDDEIFQLLRTVKGWEAGSVIGNIKIDQEAGKWFRVRGKVEDVAGLSETITVWFESNSGSYTIPIVQEMPGWMLRPGSSFIAEVTYEELMQKNWNGLRWRNIKPKKYTYLSEDELIEKIGLKLGQD